MRDGGGRHHAGCDGNSAGYDWEIGDGLDNRGLIVKRREHRPAQDVEAALNFERPNQNADRIRVRGERVATQTADRGDTAHTQVRDTLDAKLPRPDACVVRDWYVRIVEKEPRIPKRLL